MERRGYYGLKYGGQYMPEVLINALTAVENEFEFVANDGCYTNEVDFFQYQYAGRKTPLYKCRRLTKECDGADIYVKREDIGVFGSTNFNFIAGQVIIGKRIGKTQIISAAPDMDFALAVASCGAVTGLLPTIFIGNDCYHEEKLSKLTALNANIIVVKEGRADFYEAREAALHLWSDCTQTTMYVESSAMGAHPYPKMVEELAKVVGKEIKDEFLDTLKKLPDMVITPLGIGAASVGTFSALEEDEVKLVGVEEEKLSIMNKGRLGIHQGMCSLFLEDEEDDLIKMPFKKYAGVEPKHVALKESGKASYVTVTRHEAKEAFKKLASLEGILASYESCLAIAYAMKQATSMTYEQNVVVTLAGSLDQAWIDECLKES